MRQYQMDIDRVPVIFQDIRYLVEQLESASYSSIHVLADTNTSEYCMPLLETLDWPTSIHRIVIDAGESAKHLRSCEHVWRTLTEQGADRRSLVINLGGGVVTDLGGFCAATFMRGITFVHVPTSVLGMSDAAIGGKHGVDFEGLKNYVGLFVSPRFVWIDTAFLKTLPLRHVRNGLAEIIKHGCIGDPSLLDSVEQAADLGGINWNEMLRASLHVKKKFVEIDPLDQSLRAALNFGHTIGHAYETFGLQEGIDLLHGEAVALGMLAACAISMTQAGFPLEQFRRLHQIIDRLYPDLRKPEIPMDLLDDLIAKDKKRQSQSVKFVLLKSFGSPLIGQSVAKDRIHDAVSNDKKF